MKALVQTVCAASLTLACGSAAIAQPVVDIVVSADARIQTSGVLGSSVQSESAVNINTSMSGPNNISNGVFEFDLSSLAFDAVITEATLLLRTDIQITNLGGNPAPLSLFGFTGDGTVTVADNVGGTLIGSRGDLVGTANNTDFAIDLTAGVASLNAVLADANSDDFFTIRSETISFASFIVDALESTDADAVPATLRLTLVPEPTTAGLLGLGGLALLARRRRQG